MGGRRVALVAVGVAVVFVGVIVAALVVRVETNDLEAARDLVDDGDQWQTATESAEKIAGVADALLEVAHAEGCGPDVAPGSRCAGILRSAAWAQIAAVGALRCTQPYIIEIRRDLADLLDALANGGTGLSSPPPRPAC